MEVMDTDEENAAPQEAPPAVNRRVLKKRRKMRARKIRMADDNMPEEADEWLTELFKVMSCSICLTMARKGALCPKCSILSCKPCIHSWMRMHKPRSCPQCKCLLTKQKYIKLPILPELEKRLKNLRTAVALEVFNLRKRIKSIRKQDLTTLQQQEQLQLNPNVGNLEMNQVIPNGGDNQVQEIDPDDVELEEELAEMIADAAGNNGGDGNNITEDEDDDTDDDA